MAQATCSTSLRGVLFGTSIVLGVAFAHPATAAPRGFGSRETALAGGVSADVSDFTANYYNPAGLARARGPGIGIGYFRTDARITSQGQESSTGSGGLTGGLVAPGRLFGRPVALGLGLHSLYLAANVAVSPWDWLQIGGGLAFISATRARLNITGSADIFRTTESQLRHEVDTDLTAVRYPQAGVRVALSDRVALALVYRGQYKLGVDISARVTAGISGLTTARYEYDNQTVNDFLPQQVVLGGAWTVTDALRVLGDATWENYSARDTPDEPRVSLDIPAPRGGWPPNIAPPSIPPTTAGASTLPTPWKDRVVPRVGIELRVLDTGRFQGFVRGGYEFGRSITGRPDDPSRHAASFGLGARLVRPASFLPGEVRLDTHVRLSVPLTTPRAAPDAGSCTDDETVGRSTNIGATLSIALERAGE